MYGIYFVLTCIVDIRAADVGAIESLILRFFFGKKLSGGVVPAVVVMNVDDGDVVIVEFTS